MNEKHGGPAFPTFEMVEEYSEGKQQYVSRPHALSGMSLRDYFAGQALAGLLARSTMDVPHCEGCRPVADDPGEHYADIAYRYADAMLAERAK